MARTTTSPAAVNFKAFDGLVENQRDYWDMAGLLLQLGVLPAPTT